MKLSIVTTLYHSSPYIIEFYERISKAASKITGEYEIIFVNDGSPDDSLGTVIELFEKDNKIKIIDLSRNFGHHKAMMTGLSYAKGDYVFLIDCDLEEEPELLERFWMELQNSKDTDVVFGVQETRKGNLFEQYTGKLFYKIFNVLSDYKIPENFLVVRLMTGRYVENLIKHNETDLIFSAISIYTGFNQKPLYVKKHCKRKTVYTFKRKISLAVNSIISFSAKPLVYICYLGFFILSISSLAILWLLIRKLYYSMAMTGWTSLIVSVWFFGGLNLFCTGLIGIYLEKLFKQTKNRPFTIIKQIYEKI
jgi:putative glycosyltransferase